MPLVLVQMFFYSVCMLAGGCMLTWMIQSRRYRREREAAEQEMVEALEARYRVYQDLEQGMKRVLARLDAMDARHEARVQEPAQVAARRAGGRRGADEGAWDAERAFESQRAELAEEVAAQGRRIAELMGETEALERLEERLVEAQARCSELSAALESEGHARREIEQAHAERVGGLTRRMHELEAHSEQLSGTQMELDEMRARTGESDRRRKAEIDQLQQRVSELEAVEVELEDARAGLQVREHAAEELRGAVAELEERLQVLEVEHARALVGLRETHAQRESELKASHSQALTALQERLAAAEQQAESLRVQLAAKEADLLELRASREALERDLLDREAVVASRDAEVQAREQDLQTSLAQLAEAQEGLRQRDAILQQREAEVARLTQAWEGAEAQVKVHKTRLEKHAEHVEAAQHVLSELRPMIEALESRLHGEPAQQLDSVAAPLPARKPRRAAPAKPEAPTGAKAKTIEDDLGILDLGD